MRHARRCAATRLNGGPVLPELQAELGASQATSLARRPSASVPA
jgi:hypothetical protein